MKKIYASTLLFSLALVAIAFGPQISSAKSVQWNTTVNKTLAYCWSNGVKVSSCPKDNAKGGWAPGLINPNMSVSYHAVIKNEDTGAVIADGASIPVGTRIRLVPIPHAREHISWFGTGTTLDSPYGHWNVNANPLPNRCDVSNRTTAYNDFFDAFGDNGFGAGSSVYTPLVVAPPSISFSSAGTAKLTCTAGGALCTVNSGGTIQPRVTFSPTIGKFYYGYAMPGLIGNKYTGSKYDWSCMYNNIPMATASYQTDPYFGFTTGVQGSASTYTLNVPTQTVAFSLNAVSSNNPPNPPTITGATSFNTGTAQTFGFKATDPDNDTIRYQVDWNKDGVVDVYAPSNAAYVSSGSTQNANRQWATAGTYTFQARTQDNKGLMSSWKTYTVTVTNPGPTLSLTADSTNVTYNTGTTLRWTGTNVTSCTASNGWSGTKASTGAQATGNLTSSKTYKLDCTGPGGTISKSVTISVVIPTPALTFTADSTNVTYNTGTTLRWTGTNVTSCTASNGWSGTKASTGAQATGNLTSSKTYKLDCTGPGGTISKSVTISVQQPPAPTATLQVRVNNGAWTTADQIIEPADVVDVQWNSTNATTCDAQGFTAGATSGTSLKVTKPAAGITKTYKVECSNLINQKAEASVGVTLPNRNPTLTTSSLTVTSGSNVILTYDLNNNPSCTFKTADTTLNNSVVSTSGARQTGAITQQTVYTLECPGGNAAIIINIEGDIREQ